MALTLDELTDEVAVVLGTARRTSDDLRVSIKRWLNQAFRLIARKHPWDGMRGEQTVTTVAPYDTGTATFTNGSLTVTGAGTTWTAAMVGRKIAVALGKPYYRIAAWVSATEVTLATGNEYREDTVAGSAYTIFQDEYDLLTTTHSVESIVPQTSRFGGPLAWAETYRLEMADYLGLTDGEPAAWGVVTSTTIGTPRIRVLPVSDDAYRLIVRFLKRFADMTNGTDLYTTQGLPEDVEELAIDRALRWAPRIEGSRRVMTDAEWRKDLFRVWANHHKARYRTWQRQGVLGGGGARRIVVDMSGIAT